jgi:hypothetical protein
MSDPRTTTGRIEDEFRVRDAVRPEAFVFGQAVSPEFRAAFDEEYRLHTTHRGMWWRYLGIALVTAIVTFSITWAIAASRPVTLTLASTNVGISATPKVFTQNTTAPTSTASASANNSGQVALTEAQLKAEVKNVGGNIYWAGSVTNSLYTLNHIKNGQDFVRYLPNGQGLGDSTQNYRVIATYRDPNAFATVTAAARISAGISFTNPDGSFVYYAKDTPTHVYLVFKNLPYQIEIFDPVAGESLKLARTPGIIKSVI